MEKIRNYVAKNVKKANKGGRHKDKKNDYQRKAKNDKSCSKQDFHLTIPKINVIIGKN